MNSFRSFLLFFTLSIHGIVCPHPLTENLESTAQNWSEKAISTLSVHDLNLLANFLFFNFKSSWYDMQTRSLMAHLAENMRTLHAMSEQYHQDTAELMMQYATALHALTAKLWPQTFSAFKTWQHCCNAIETHTDAHFKALIDELIEYEKQSIRQALSMYQKDLHTTYSTLETHLDELMQQLSLLKNPFKKILEGKRSDYSNQKDHDIADFDAAFIATDLLLNKTAEYSMPVYNIKRMGIALIELNTNNFAAFYHALYQKLRLIKSPFALMILFNEKGKLTTPATHEPALLPSLEQFMNSLSNDQEIAHASY